MPPPTRFDGSSAPLLSAFGIGLALVAAQIPSWPILVTGSYDLRGHQFLHTGRQIVWACSSNFSASISAAPPTAMPAAEARQTAERDERARRTLRRPLLHPRSTGFFAGAMIWPAGFALLQAAMTLWILFALIGPVRSLVRLGSIASPAAQAPNLSARKAAFGPLSSASDLAGNVRISFVAMSPSLSIERQARGNGMRGHESQRTITLAAEMSARRMAGGASAANRVLACRGARRVSGDDHR